MSCPHRCPQDAQLKLRYDPLKDFEPVSLVGFSPTLLVANPNAAVKDVKDLVAQLKAKPDKFSYASAGNGTAPHFAAELFKLATATSMTHVPHKGSSPALTDTIGGQTEFMFPSVFSALPFVKTGKLRPLALAGPKRSPVLPAVPTLAEAGVDGVDVTQWYAFFAPAGTPKPVIEQLNVALGQVLTTPDVARRIAEQGVDVQISSPAELCALVEAELAKWRGVVQRARLTPD